MIKGRTTPARKTRLTLYADIGLNLNSAKGDSNEKMVCSGCGPACGCRSQGSDGRRSGEQHRSLPVLPSLEQSPVPLRFHLEVVRALSFMSKAGLSAPQKPVASLAPEKSLSARPIRFHERARHSRVHDSRPSTRSPPGIAITDRRSVRDSIDAARDTFHLSQPRHVRQDRVHDAVAGLDCRHQAIILLD